ncbi:hypothetical protein [Bacteroides sp. 51]|nr:hypothetical protein [Bacteroides sp. 51]
MKDLKKKVVMQELSKEEATTTYGGGTGVYIKTIYKDGKLYMVLSKTGK